MQITGSLKNHQHPELSVVRSGNLGITDYSSIKFPDGTMICIHNVQQADIINNKKYEFNWKTPFKDKPVVFTNICQNEASFYPYSGVINVNYHLSTNSKCVYNTPEFWDNYQGKIIISFMGIGRWK